MVTVTKVAFHLHILKQFLPVCEPQVKVFPTAFPNQLASWVPVRAVMPNSSNPMSQVNGMVLVCRPDLERRAVSSDPQGLNLVEAALIAAAPRAWLSLFLAPPNFCLCKPNCMASHCRFGSWDSLQIMKFKSKTSDEVEIMWHNCCVHAEHDVKGPRK